MRNMAEEVDVPFNGRTAKAVEVPIADSHEEWSEFVLGDGTKIRAKVNIVAVYKLADEKDQLGNPIYSINAAPIIAMLQPSRKAE